MFADLQVVTYGQGERKTDLKQYVSSVIPILLAQMAIMEAGILQKNLLLKFLNFGLTCSG